MLILLSETTNRKNTTMTAKTIKNYIRRLNDAINTHKMALMQEECIAEISEDAGTVASVKSNIIKRNAYIAKLNAEKAEYIAKLA